jgi:tetratricopeptide (TPR) repeat protein
MAFHQQTAETLQTFYATDEEAPEGWQHALMWHWEQAGQCGKSMNVALDVAHNKIQDLRFTEARQWIEQSLALLDRMPASERASFGLQYEMRAYALIVAVLEFEGQFREALGYAQLLLRLTEVHGNVNAQSRSYLTIGRVHRELGQLSLAESDLMRALSLAERHQLRELEWEARFHLAKVHQLQGRHLEAFQQLDLAHRGVSSVGEGDQVAQVCTGIGDIYRVLGSGDEALRLYHQALKLEIGSKNRLGQAMLYEKLCLSHMEIRELGEALDCINEALRLRTNLDDKLGQARSYSILGTIHYRLKKFDLAREYFDHARVLEEQLQNRRGLTIALTNLGDVERVTENYERARSYYREALVLARGIGDQVAMARLYERMGDAFHEDGNEEEAKDYWRHALQIRDEMGHFDEAQNLRYRLEGIPEDQRNASAGYQDGTRTKTDIDM